MVVRWVLGIVLTLACGSAQAFSGSAPQAARSRISTGIEGFQENRTLARQYLSRKRFAQAIPFLEKARSLNDSDFDNGYDLSVAYAQTRQWDKARAEIQRLLKLRKAPELHSLLAEIASANHERKEAAAEYQIAAQLDPSELRIADFGQSLLLFDGDAAVTIFSYGVRKFPESGRLRTGLGIAYYFYGDFDKAAETLCQAVDLNPGDPRPIEFLGKLENQSYEIANQVNQRLSAFLKIHPDNARANYYLGRNLLHPPGREPSQENKDQGERLLRTAIRLDPRLANAYFELGQLSEKKGNESEASDLYEHAIRLDPSQSRYHYRLSFVYRRTGQVAKARREVDTFKRLHAAEETMDTREREQIDRETLR